MPHHRGLHTLFVLAAVVVGLLDVGCRSNESGRDSSPASASSNATTATPSTGPVSSTFPSPSLPTTPSCRLLTRGEVQAALSGGSVQAPFGNLFRHANGPAGLLVDIDMCSWQQGAGSEPGRVVQVQVDTASSESAAIKEYEAFIAAAIQNDVPGSTPARVPNLGSRAAQIPGWIFVQKGTAVLAVTVSRPVDPDTLRALASAAARRLGW